MDKVKLHIPILTAEQVVVRDRVVRQFTEDYGTVVVGFEEIVRTEKDKILLCPFSILQLYRDKVTDKELKYFKRVAGIISGQTGESIVLEVTRETVYVGTITEAYKEEVSK